MNEELYHYGVLGMKWGVRKRDKEYKHAKKKESNDSDGKTKKKRKGLSKNTKKAIKIGAAVLATALVSYGTYKLVKSGKADGLIKNGKSFMDNMLSKKSSSKKESLDSILKDVNPFRGTADGNTNCTSCSIATALRQRGMRVQAIGGIDRRNLGGVIESAFKSAKVYDMRNNAKVKSADGMASVLLKRFKSEDCFGVISIPFDSTGKGHAFNWQIKDGVVTFFDGQQALGDASKYFKFADPSSITQFARLDNLEVREEFLDEVVKRIK